MPQIILWKFLDSTKSFSSAVCFRAETEVRQNVYCQESELGATKEAKPLNKEDVMHASLPLLRTPGFSAARLVAALLHCPSDETAQTACTHIQMACAA
jgi:hypothetical protein